MGEGPLGDPNSSTQPKARVSYIAGYFDAADRLTDQVNVGTNGGSAYTRPGTVPARSDTVLVTHNDYDPAGNLYLITDPKALKTQFAFDMLGRKTQEIDASSGGTPATGMNITNWTYNGNDQILTLQAYQPGGTGSTSQTTGYIYGIGGTKGTNLFSNDVIGKIEYPDKTTGQPSAAAADDVSSTYDLLGEVLTKTDQNQTAHAYAMDILGRTTSDTITDFGSADSPASQHTFAFNALGLLYLATSNNGQGAINQVERLYNGLGQLTGEYQEAYGAVNTSTSPEVQYVYDTPAHGSRLEEIVYPSGYTLHDGYDGNALDNAISRVDYLADDNGAGGVGQHLEEYSYLGLDTIVIRNRPQEQAQLTYVKQSGESNGDAGDQYTGLDRFGRVDDQRWIPISNPTSPIARFQQGYDRDSNVLWKQDLVTANSSELFAYDNLNRLANFSAGTLSADHTSITGTPTSTWGVTLDSIGNRDTATLNGAPTNSTFNARNQQTAYGATTLTNDNNGALTTDQTGQTFTYDGWGELHANTDSSVFYFYDALGRRISNDHSEQLIYSQDGQVLEDRHMHKDPNLNVVLDSIDRQVWGQGYVDQMVLRDHVDEGTQTTTRVYALQDANYNTVAITDSTGNVLDRFAYDPDGNVRSGNPSANGWIYLWQGLRRETAGTTFLYDGRSRFYSPVLGRWIQPDATYIDSTNLYEFELGRTLDGVDPYGLSFLGSVGRILVSTGSGAGAGAAAGAGVGAGVGAVVGGVAGAGVGALPGAGTGALAGGIAGGISGGISGLVNGILNEVHGTNQTVGGAAKSGAISGGISGAVSGVVPGLGAGVGTEVGAGVSATVGAGVGGTAGAVGTAANGGTTGQVVAGGVTGALTGATGAGAGAGGADAKLIGGLLGVDNTLCNDAIMQSNK